MVCFIPFVLALSFGAAYLLPDWYDGPTLPDVMRSVTAWILGGVLLALALAVFMVGSGFASSLLTEPRKVFREFSRFVASFFAPLTSVLG